MTWGQLLRAVLSTLFGARARTLLSRLRDLGRSLSSLARTVASPLLARWSQRAGRGSEEPTPDEAAAPTAEEAAGPDPAQPVQTFPEDTGKPRRVGFLVWVWAVLVLVAEGALRRIQALRWPALAGWSKRLQDWRTLQLERLQTPWWSQVRERARKLGRRLASRLGRPSPREAPVDIFAPPRPEPPAAPDGVAVPLQAPATSHTTTPTRWAQVGEWARGLPHRLRLLSRGLRTLRWARVLAWTRRAPAYVRQRGGALKSVRWSQVPAGAIRTVPRTAAYVRGVRWRSLATDVRQLPREALLWWRGLSRARRAGMVTVVVLIGLGVPLTFFTINGILAAQEARQAYRDLQDELAHFTPVDLIQVNLYNSLEDQFREAEESSDRARSSLAFLKVFGWVPVVGGKINEVHRLLDMGFHQGRAGRNLAQAYGSAIDVSLDDLPPNEAAAAVSRALREAAPKLAQVQEDLRRVVELRAGLGNTPRGQQYGVLVDRYFGAIQTVAYLSTTSPEAIGHTYALSRELTVLRDLATDLLDVIASPERVGRSLDHVKEQAQALEETLELVRQAIRTNSGEDLPERERREVEELLATLSPGISLLRHATAGTRSLVTMATAIEDEGFLSQGFGQAVGRSVDEAVLELRLAREETSSLQALLSLQGLDAESFLPSVLFDREAEFTVTPTERVEALLDEAISATNFLHSFLGYDAAKTYLLLGQNQNEIRASGGFIGIGVEATLDRGELTELVYHDSTTVDKEPLTDNPVPPEGLYWYLWMGNLLFRDANWNPHFPSAAGEVRDIYRRGQGVTVDGIITSTKLLAFDMVEMFGDVTVPELDEPLNRLSAEEYSESDDAYRCLPRHTSLRPKRCFDEDLFFSIKDRLTSGVGASTRGNLVELVKEHLDMKNMMIHVFPPVDDSFLWERGWNGAVPLVDHDYLMVVDSSLPGHSAATTQRSWEYSVSLHPNKPVEAHLRIRYENTEQPKDAVCLQFAWAQYHCYWNYFRVFISPLSQDVRMAPVPLHEGSLKLIWGYPDPDSAVIVPNANTGPSRMTELGGFIPVEPGSVVTIPIEYRLPPEAIRETAEGVFEYRLLVQKQPGMDRDLVSLAVELPDGAKILNTTPSYNSSIGNWYLFDFPLRADTTVVVSFKA